MGRTAGRISAVNLDRSTQTADDAQAARDLVERWRVAGYCPGREAAVLGRLHSSLWRNRKLRAASRSYRLHLVVAERTRLWPQMKAAVARLNRVKGFGPERFRLTSIVGQLTSFDPSGLFPVPTDVLSRTQLRSALIRQTEIWVREYVNQFTVHEPKIVRAMVADFLTTTCPDICHDVTPERVRKLVAYRPVRKKALRK